MHFISVKRWTTFLARAHSDVVPRLRFARNNFLPTVCVMSEGSGTPAGEHMQTSCQECNPRVITVAPLFGHPCPPATPPRLGLDTIYLTSGDRPAGLRRRWRRPANRTRLQRRHGVPVAAHPHPDQHTRGFTRVVSPSTGEPSRAELVLELDTNEPSPLRPARLLPRLQSPSL